MKLMTASVIVVFCIGVFYSRSFGQTKLPILEKPFKILAGDKPIQTEMAHAAPFLYDFNKDGKKDLIVGQFGGGKVRLYLNNGTDANPRFDTFSYIQAAGKDASVKAS